MIIKYFIILIIIEGIFSQDCNLNDGNMDKKWIYAIKPTPTTWDVLHTDYIKDQTTLYLICNANTQAREIFCNRGQLQENSRAIPKCSRRIKASVTLITNENSCSRLGGQLYQIQYTLPNNAIIPLYTVCYSLTNEQCLYARHRSYGFKLPATNYKRPSLFTRDIVSRDREESFRDTNIFKSFVRLLGTGQKYVPDEKALISDRGHLVNSQDFPTYDQMDETFKYVNVMPQFRDNNRSSWKRIENWIHRLPLSNTYAEVVTGTFGILTLPHSQTKVEVPMYLMANNKNPIPLWTYKVVKYNNMCYAFVSLNNDFNENPTTSTPNCEPVTCPNGLVLSGISYCCKYNHFARQIGVQAALC